jgi:hypothetical protein
MFIVKNGREITVMAIEEEHISFQLQRVFDENNHCSDPKLYEQMIKSFVKLGIKKVGEYNGHSQKNCYGFAFDILDDEYDRYLELFPEGQKNVTLVESKEVLELIGRGILKTVPSLDEKAKPTKGNLIIYRNKNDTVLTTHAGIVVKTEPEIVIHSKWFLLPAIFEHKRDQVPSGYGHPDDKFYFIADRKKLQKYVEEIIKTKPQRGSTQIKPI